MERLGIVGASWRQVGSRGLESLGLSVDEQRSRLPDIRRRAGVEELVFLATCNRVEILFVDDARSPREVFRPRLFEALTGRPPAAGEAQRTFRAWAGEGALEHLLLVAAGLDSAQVGEQEIRGQLRAALELSEELGLCGPRLRWLVHQALRVAREVHRRSGLDCGRRSLAEIGLERVRQRLRRAPGPVALVGVSAMTRRCGLTLAQAGASVVVVNRRPERAAELARTLDADLRSLKDFRRRPGELAAVVLATGADRPVLDRAALLRLATGGAEPPLVVDFGVPPDVDPEAARDLGIERLGMAEINAEAEGNRRRRLDEAADARALVDQALDDLRRQLAERMVSPVLSELARRYRRTAEETLERLLRRQLPDLDDRQRQALEGWSRNLAKRLAHVPTAGLRALAADHGTGAVETFLAAADRELADELGHGVSGDAFRVDPQGAWP